MRKQKIHWVGAACLCCVAVVTAAVMAAAPANESTSHPVIDSMKSLLDTQEAAVIGDTPAEMWRASNGTVIIHFNDALLTTLGVQVADLVETAARPDAESMLWEPPYFAFALSADSDLRFDAASTNYGNLDGTIRVEGGFTLISNGASVGMYDFAITPNRTGEGTGSGPEVMHVAIGAGDTAPAAFAVRPGIANLDRPTRQLTLGGMDLVVTPVLASALNRPDLEDMAIGSLHAVSRMVHVQGQTVEPETLAEYTPSSRGALFDVKLGELYSFQTAGRVGTFPNGTEGCTMATTSCNVGELNVPWLAAMTEDHPVISMNLYRVMNDRFEHIGMSWLKHGFFALSNSQCTPCQNPSGGDFLGVGCSDTYGTGNNSDRNWLGPRHELTPANAVWECTGSHFDGTPADCIRSHGSAGHDAAQHRCRIKDSDLGLAGATYYYEAFYHVRDEKNTYNNIGYKPVTTSWTGSAWTYTSTGFNVPPVEGPAVYVWGDEHKKVQTRNGDVILAIKVVDLGGGSWRYTYVLYNHTYEPEFQSLSIPVPDGVNLSNIGFKDYDDLELATRSNVDWGVTLGGGQIVWATESFGSNPNANSLRYSTAYTFWFDADQPPQTGVVITAPNFRPGFNPALVNFLGTGPSAPPLLCGCGDMDADGMVDNNDFAAFSTCFGLSAPSGSCPQDAFDCADLDGSGDITLDDFATLSLSFGGPPNC